MTTNIAMVMPAPGEPLQRVEREVGEPEAHEAVVRLHASSMNYHDLVNLQGNIRGGPWPRVPMSDGAGEVVSIGEQVRHVAVGDRVCAGFSPRWLRGEPTPGLRGDVLGDTRDGCLQQYLRISADALVKVPAHLDDSEAATLPCAGVTAWTALREGGIKAGDVVVAQGTGGVSLYVVQLAKAFGAEVILTSSSDEKLKTGRNLGADHVINYRTTPEWGKRVRQLTGGRGVDIVVDVGGEATLPQSVIATRMRGTIAIVGILSGYGAASIPVTTVMMGMQRIVGIAVGSVADLADLSRAVAVAGFHPPISHRFDWSEIPAAMETMREQRHVGKIAIGISG